MIYKGFDLTVRVALVTDGSKGLGKEMARAFAEAGANVFIFSRHESELRPALAEIRAGTGREGVYIVADMNNRDDVKRLAEAALAKMGRVDILVNNAGSNAPAPIDQIKDEDWDRILELNLTSIMALTRALAPQMKERKLGRIIHISSIMGFVSKGGRAPYSATKSALIGFAKGCAIDLGTFGITVNCIAPRPVTHRPADESAFARGEGRLRESDHPRALGRPKGIDGPGAVARQRRGFVYHGRNAGRRRRLHLEVIFAAAERAFPNFTDAKVKNTATDKTSLCPGKSGR
jgi:NAD(P)-dependent dehydrogenase (short-subunit alcohol dehydrogenase family)